MASNGIEIRNLYKIFGAHGRDYVEAVSKGMSKTELNAEHGHVLGLKDINITIPGGQITVIMGLSGSGKSTLIRHINRLIEPTSGEIIYGGTDICRMSADELREFRRKKTAMVFQKFGLLPHRTVLQNAAYGLDIQGVAKAEREARARRWINRVGLEGFDAKYPNQLSGGMQQRVGLARALANDAEILLMDEAYSALDPLIRVDMQTVLLDLQKELKKTVVFITHDLDEALRLGDKIAILRDGEIVQQGKPEEIVMKPANDYIRSFVKEVNRGRAIKVAAVAKPLSPGEPGPSAGTGIDGELSVEDALKAMLSAATDRLAVLGADRQPLGMVTRDQLLHILVMDEA